MTKYKVQWFDTEDHTLFYTSWRDASVIARRLVQAGFTVYICAIKV